MLNIQRLSKTNKLILASFAFLAVLALGGGRAHAATLNVATGTDETTTNSSCSLSEAIQNINDQATTNTDCLAGDGNNDTISIPAGTITLAADLSQITEPVKIQGAGMNSTTINGDGLYSMFDVNAGPLTLSGMKITNYTDCAVLIATVNVVNLQNLDIDGNAGSTSRCAVKSRSYSSSSSSVFNVTNVYIHDYALTGNSAPTMLLITQGGGGTTTANIHNVTLANISLTDATVTLLGIALNVGMDVSAGGAQSTALFLTLQ